MTVEALPQIVTATRQDIRCLGMRKKQPWLRCEALIVRLPLEMWADPLTGQIEVVCPTCSRVANLEEWR